MKVNVIANRKSVYDTLLPITLVSRLLGIRGITRNQYGNYNYSWSSLIMTLAYVVAFYVILKCYDNHEITLSVENGSDIILVMRKFYYIGSIVSMTFSYFLCHVHYRNEVTVLKTIEEVDANLKSYNLGDNIEKKETFLKRLQYAYIFFVYIIFIAAAILFQELMYVREGPVYWVQFVFPAIINSTIKLQFHMYNLVLISRTEIINGNLNNRIASSTPASKFTAFYQMEKDIESTMKIHKKITDTSRLVNRIYGVQELFSFALCFVVLLSEGYIVLYSVTVGEADNFGYTLFSSLRLVIFYLLELLIDLRACMLLCAKVNI